MIVDTLETRVKMLSDDSTTSISAMTSTFAAREDPVALLRCYLKLQLVRWRRTVSKR